MGLTTYSLPERLEPWGFLWSMGMGGDPRCGRHREHAEIWPV